ncbi:hypothetical protein VZQ01_08145 [Myxococcus faecalis]|uniref:patatin-like phospholipase family protein n=1 Tax=Myxococcus faecalis TaxID=3115646 RepID=UPI003CE7A607
MQDEALPAVARSELPETYWKKLGFLAVVAAVYFLWDVGFLQTLPMQEETQAQQNTRPFSSIEWLILLLPVVPVLLDAAKASVQWRSLARQVQPPSISWGFVALCWFLTHYARTEVSSPDRRLFYDHVGLASVPVLSLVATLGYVLIRAWQGCRPRGLLLGIGWLVLLLALIGWKTSDGWPRLGAGNAPSYKTLMDYQTAPSDFPFLATHDGAYPREPLRGYRAEPELRPEQNDQCTVVLSMSGGGTNSASFAWGAIHELNEAFPERQRSVLREFDYLVTASGGGLMALSLMEILREADLRGDTLSSATARDYLESSRFFSVLGLSYLPSTKDAFLRNVLDGRAASRVRAQLKTAFVGLDGGVCKGDYAGPLRSVPREGAAFETYATCSLTSPLSFNEVFPPEGVPVKLPVFVATVTAYETGHVVPLLPKWLNQLGVDEIRLALPHAASRNDVLQVDPRVMDYLDAVTLSMSFPGIGPVLGTTVPLKRPDGNSIRRGIALADGGQSDNLGLGVALRLGLSHAKQHPVVHIVLDSSIQTSSPYLVRRYDFGEGLSKMVQNAVPLLGAARLEAEGAAGAQVRSVLGEPVAPLFTTARNYLLSVVRMSDVMDLNQERPTLFHALPKGGCLRRLRPGMWLPEDRWDCKPVPLKGTPQALLGHFDSSLSRNENEVQLLIDAGRNAMRMKLASGLKDALVQCLDAAQSDPSHYDIH